MIFMKLVIYLFFFKNNKSKQFYEKMNFSFQTDRTSKWKFISVINGDDVQIFELNDQEKLVKKLPKMNPCKLCQEIPKLKSYLAPYQIPFQNTIMQAQSFMPALFFTKPQQATNSNTEIQKENIVRSYT